MLNLSSERASDHLLGSVFVVCGAGSTAAVLCMRDIVKYRPVVHVVLNSLWCPGQVVVLSCMMHVRTWAKTTRERTLYRVKR